MFNGMAMESLFLPGLLPRPYQITVINDVSGSLSRLGAKLEDAEDLQVIVAQGSDALHSQYQLHEEAERP